MKYALDNQFPIETEEQLEKAAEYFDKYLLRFSPDQRATAAVEIDKRASELGVNIHKPWIVNYTRMTKSASLSPDFESAMKMRKEACIRHNVTIQAGKDNINAEAFIDGITKRAFQVDPKDTMNMLVEFDKKAGMEYLYDTEIVDPIITVFGSLNNPEFDAMKLAGDATQYDLVRASRDHEKMASITEKFGDEFASNFKQNPITSIAKLVSVEKEVLSEIAKK